ncbi:MAG: polyprenyl synthetase family protein [Bacteroidetes bacterium]|jgi:geranylgeranyl diphosphate synthase, type II|nr:polyprenyl synthetase family protein [Bacteroidota bacterium]
MRDFKELVAEFGTRFGVAQFPAAPATLYEPGEYFLSIGGKRIRPILCVLGNELFSDITEDAWTLATAIELFHNFTLIHDDMMDAAALRRGMQTVHTKYGDNTALLTGDVMLIRAYEKLQTINPAYLPKILSLFNTTAREVCEGQQLDMDFEKMPSVTLDAYIHMITLKTSVLLAASLEMGAILGGATPGNCKHIYEFGKNLGIAFQIQDDYLDAFGDPEKFGKEVGGDIRQNKKTFLLLHALEVATPDQRAKLDTLLASNGPEKVPQVMELFKACNVDAWAIELKEKYLQMALANLEDIAVTSSRKSALLSLANYLMQREN